MLEFGRFYEQQYAVALFNSVRFEIEGGGSTQTQLLHRKVKSPIFCAVMHMLRAIGGKTVKILYVWLKEMFNMLPTPG